MWGGVSEAVGEQGGSSGSPVIDILGRAIGLNAGSRTRTNTAYFLPLPRVARALGLLRQCCPAEGLVPQRWSTPHLPRGTMQATFTYIGFDEVRRLGVRRETEASVREAVPDATGMLVVDTVIPGGPAAKVCPSAMVLPEHCCDGFPFRPWLPYSAVAASGFCQAPSPGGPLDL
ncbi:hypothetical protein CYMTET_4082 [Cymbomonas tetramitiformis]|uniref:Uncharacterized protein n=1 Tax=Cymbomonas tetramitiformis TaxID=36881 RepID=A0AAE0LKR0_9CHLO|nr:hypothetical protein CYMTET_4082 [Cymbomonas tetramitiformis]